MQFMLNLYLMPNLRDMKSVTRNQVCPSCVGLEERLVQPIETLFEDSCIKYALDDLNDRSKLSWVAMKKKVDCLSVAAIKICFKSNQMGLVWVSEFAPNCFSVR